MLNNPLNPNVPAIPPSDFGGSAAGISAAGSGKPNPQIGEYTMSRGGVISEPVFGIGLYSGQHYVFGEGDRPETVVPQGNTSQVQGLAPRLPGRYDAGGTIGFDPGAGGPATPEQENQNYLSWLCNQAASPAAPATVNGVAPFTNVITNPGAYFSPRGPSYRYDSSDPTKPYEGAPQAVATFADLMGRWYARSALGRT
jgi:hypothetical protein